MNVTHFSIIPAVLQPVIVVVVSLGTGERFVPADR